MMVCFMLVSIYLFNLRSAANLTLSNAQLLAFVLPPILQSPCTNLRPDYSINVVLYKRVVMVNIHKRTKKLQKNKSIFILINTYLSFLNVSSFMILLYSSSNSSVGLVLFANQLFKRGISRVLSNTSRAELPS